MRPLRPEGTKCSSAGSEWVVKLGFELCSFIAKSFLECCPLLLSESVVCGCGAANWRDPGLHKAFVQDHVGNISEDNHQDGRWPRSLHWPESVTEHSLWRARQEEAWQCSLLLLEDGNLTLLLRTTSFTRVTGPGVYQIYPVLCDLYDGLIKFTRTEHWASLVLCMLPCLQLVILILVFVSWCYKMLYICTV